MTNLNSLLVISSLQKLIEITPKSMSTLFSYTGQSPSKEITKEDSQMQLIHKRQSKITIITIQSKKLQAFKNISIISLINQAKKLKYTKFKITLIL